MKQFFIYLPAVFFISLSLFAQSTGLGNTDPSVFTKFHLPETNLHSLYFDTDFKLSTSSQKATNGSVSINAKDFTSDITYSFSPHYYLLKENDNRVLSFEAELSGQYNKDKDNYEDYWGDYELKSRYYYLNLDLDGNYKNYFTSDKLFYSYDADISLNIKDTRSKEYYDGELEDDDYYSHKIQEYTFGIGIGFGKIREITPVISAIRFQERLKQLNLLDNDLSNQTIIDLAQQFYRSTYYSTAYDRPSKYFWDDVEKTLNKEGVSLDGLNQYGSSYLREVTDELRFTRKEGFIVGANLQFDYYNYYDIDDISESLFLLANVYSEYSHQLNLRSQVYGSLSLSGGPDIIEDPYYRQKYYINAEIGYDYEITDRLVASLNNELTTQFLNMNKQLKYLTNDLNINFNYFIEDNLSLNTTFSWDYTKDRNIAYDYRASNFELEIGFTYYIDKGLLFR